MSPVAPCHAPTPPQYQASVEGTALWSRLMSNSSLERLDSGSREEDVRPTFPMTLMMDRTSGELQVPPQSIFCLLDNRWSNLSLYSTSFSVQVTEMERSHPSPGGNMTCRGMHTALQQAVGGILGGLPHVLLAGIATCGCVAARTAHRWQSTSDQAMGNKPFLGSHIASLTTSHPLAFLTENQLLSLSFF